MHPLDLVALNLLTPVVLAFAMGIVATVVKSDLKFPEEMYTALAIYLLLAIGLKGGAELAVTPVSEFWRPALATLVLGLLTPVTAYLVARKVGGFDVDNAAAMGAHYGSVSIVTFFAALSFLDVLGVGVEAFMPTLVAVLEVPAIIVGLAIARARMGETRWGLIIREVAAGRSVFLLVGGVVVGYLSGPGGFERVAPLFADPFQGVLVLFLLDMGMLAARRLRDLRETGAFLVGFSVLVPIAHGALGVGAGWMAGLSLGGATILGVLTSSASYIAAPAAVRLALPAANPSLYLTASLGITFPFNLIVGIPLYYWFARLIFGV